MSDPFFPRAETSNEAVVHNNVSPNVQTIADVSQQDFGKTELNYAEKTVNIFSAQWSHVGLYGQ